MPVLKSRALSDNATKEPTLLVATKNRACGAFLPHCVLYDRRPSKMLVCTAKRLHPLLLFL